MLKRITCIVFMVAATATVICAVRSCSSDSEDFMRKESTSFQKRTIPCNLEAINVSDVIRSQHAARIS